MLRTHTCGELRKKHDKKKVTLCGWNHASRNHGGLIFIDLRDRYGLTQIVFDEKHNKKDYHIAQSLRREDVLQVIGKVRPRGSKLENKKLATGDVEVLVDTLKVIKSAETPPIDIDDNAHASEETRLKYRYLDLRRPMMQNNLLMRSKIAAAFRESLMAQNFMEITTPMLIKSTPEGARDYVVPSRVNPGKFYALPQSPQLYKQLLMVAGFDRYFQQAICLRDEDLRSDRQPEHMQFDLEMACVEDIYDIQSVVEKLFKHVFKKVLDINIKTPFPKISHKDAIDKYGTDKPDLRFGLEFIDLSDVVNGSDFGVFNSVLANRGQVKCINPPKDFSRKEIDAYIKFATQHGAKGMAWMRVTKDGLDSSIVKFFSKGYQEKILKATKAKPGSSLFFIADTPDVVADVLSRLRNKLADDLKLYDPKDFKFCWTVDFPLFEWDEDNKKWEMEHHFFCMPNKEHLKYIKSDPGKVYCSQFDLVLNGWELCSGSIRINDPKIQEEIMGVVGLSKNDAEKKFGFLIDSYKYGCPPHGGVGLGFDRIVSLMCGVDDIREVIAFPKNKAAECPMDGCPSKLDDPQLKELNIKTVHKKK